LSICTLILNSLGEFPRCRCEDAEKKMRVEPTGSEFRATCEFCGFESVTVDGRWVGVETVKVDHRRLVM
jgi:hypothetical protein